LFGLVGNRVCRLLNVVEGVLNDLLDFADGLIGLTFMRPLTSSDLPPMIETPLAEETRNPSNISAIDTLARCCDQIRPMSNRMIKISTINPNPPLGP
jgi:hypothetical protein